MNTFSHIELDEKKLAERTLAYILTIQNTYLESALFKRILDPREKYGDLNNHIDFLKERLSHLEFFVDYTDVTFENKMKYYELYKYVDGIKYDDSGVLVRMSNKIEEFSKEIFWADEEQERIYQEISDFVSSGEEILPAEKLHSKLINAPFYNIDGWLGYYQTLLNIKFPKFSEKIVSGKTIIKYRPFKGKYFIGIESDYQNCKKDLKKGNWANPDYKLVIFEKITEKKINRVVVFENFVHPHLDPPAFLFKRYETLKTMNAVGNGFVFDVGIRKEFYDDGTVRIYNTGEFDDLFKRHAFFYYHCLHETTKDYIDFIEESFEE